MQCYTELVPPSAVTHALALPLTSSDASNLIVAKTSLLQIFSLKQTSHAQDAKLVLLAEYSLAGTVTALGRVKILNSKSGGAAILVALRDAKLSLIEWDPEKHTISTISIHYYEGDTLQRSPWVPDLRDCPNHLTVDPSSRCAVFNFGITNIAIIPFHQIGDELVMDDYDAEFDGEDAEASPTKKTNADMSKYQTPYASSFVLPLTVLDPGILHPVHLAFLHEYREPTFGIIYSSCARSSALHYERKDVTQYAVFTLDLEQRASTTLLSISRLPNDLFAVVPLPLPVGGALLVGTNELIHVDQAGKTTAIGVNEFARQLSSFAMTDQSESRMRLEGCQIELLNASNGDMLIALATGHLVVLNFRLDGRSVSGMSIRLLQQEQAQVSFRARASCIVSMGPHRLFLGSAVADSVLLSTARKISQLKKHSSRAAQTPLDDGILDRTESEDDEEEDGEDDDDLYGQVHDKDTMPQPEGVAMSAVNIRVLDRLRCTAPLRDVTVGRGAKRKRDDDDGLRQDSSAKLDLVVCSGEGSAGGVTVFNRELRPEIVNKHKISGAKGVWSFSVRASAAALHRSAADRSYDDFMIASILNDAGQAESILYQISDQRLQEKRGTDFDPSSGRTIECGFITSGAHFVQILEAQVLVYDQDFGLTQILPIVDEETDANAKAISASIRDPYVVIVREDHSIMLLKMDKKGELDEEDLGPDLANKQYTSASLYMDSQGNFSTRKSRQGASVESEAAYVLVLLSSTGALSVYRLSDLKTRIFHYEGAQFLPSILSQNTPLPRHWKNAEALSEVLLADLGDANDTHPYLLFRTAGGDVVLYEPFFLTAASSSQSSPPAIGFKRTMLRRNPRTISESLLESDDSHLGKNTMSMKTALVNGLFVILLPGQSPALVAKVATSSPRVYNVSIGPTATFTGYNTAWCSQGFGYIDQYDNLAIASLPPEISLGHSEWVSRKVELGIDVSGIAYLERIQSYVLATSTLTDFQLPQDDEWHAEWKNEDATCLPQLEQGSVRLLSSTTFTVIDSFQLENAERAMCIKSMKLEVSEETHECKDLIVVGTAITKGEDMVARGAIYIFDIVDVVPEPGIPETNSKLKLLAKEEVKGAVTSLCPIGSQGFMLAAQGQKCMVRGLKEDLTVLPVAFMDMKYYVKVVKELAGTGLCILGDAMSGLWFVGYSEEPYKLQLLGRDQIGLEVMAAEFLPDGKNLYLIAADGDGDLHVMQFDPESPESERGTKLLHRSTFSSGCFVSCMTLLPRSADAATIGEPAPAGSSYSDDLPSTASQQILVTSQEGSIGLITPLPEQSYRRLLALQNILTANLEHPCGLNPRAYRAVETDGVGGAAIIDGNLVQRWLETDSFHQSSMADKVGSTVWEVREDLNEITGNSLLYL